MLINLILLPLFDAEGFVLEFCLFTLLVWVVLFGLLPISLVLRASRIATDAPVDVELSLGLYRACVGIVLQIQNNRPSLHFALFNRVVPYLAFALRTKKSTPTNAQPIQQTPTQEQTAAPAYQDLPAEPTDSTNRLKTIDWMRIGLSPTLYLLRRFPRVFSLHMMAIQGRLGLEDPMLTGALFGYQRALMALPFKRLRLELIPDFCIQGFSGQAHMAIGIHLGKFLLFALGFALHAGLRYVKARYTSRPLRYF